MRCACGRLRNFSERPNRTKYMSRYFKADQAWLNIQNSRRGVRTHGLLMNPNI